MTSWPRKYPDLDCKVGTIVFASWAAVVASPGKIDGRNHQSLIQALEVSGCSLHRATADYVVQDFRLVRRPAGIRCHDDG